jgi:putative flippase GtrA
MGSFQLRNIENALSREFILNSYKTAGQMGRFACVGALATLVQYGILIFLVQVFGINPVLSSVLGFLCSICLNYYLNYRITFCATTAHSKTIGMFFLVAAVGLFLNAVLMSLCVNLLHWNYIAAQVTATGCVFIWNFTANKLWTFGAAGRRGDR